MTPQFKWNGLFLILLIGLPQTVNSIELRHYKPYNYEVLFTNPSCKSYLYETPLFSQTGQEIPGKTKDAYCKSGDSRRSGKREGAPLKRLLEWIEDSQTKEIFLAYLSFSKQSIAKALCQAIKKRNVKVTLVIDSRNETDPHRMAKANYLSRCRPQNISANHTPNDPVVITTGHDGRGRDRVGYAHNKLILINPHSRGATKIGFSSGNLSSGTTIHHENWHFITTSSQSYFAQAHKCLMKGVLNHSQGKKAYSQFIQKCRDSIQAPEESDIKVYFIPGNGDSAIAAIKEAAHRSQSISIAAHRFSNSQLITILQDGLKRSTRLRLIVDDDIYWTARYGRGMGRNQLGEYGKINRLRKAGMRVKYIETYADDVFEPKSLQLQHNKFLIFKFKTRKGAVFTGAGNLTTAAFTTNFENFYYITIPEVHRAFEKQYHYLWNKLARSYQEMPTELALP